MHPGVSEPLEMLLTTKGAKKRLIKFSLIKLPSNLTQASAAATVSHVKWMSGKAKSERLFLVLAPYVSAPMAAYFRENGIQYLDRLGNCSLDLGDGQRTHVQAFKPSREATGTREFRAPGLQLILALLVDPDLVNEPVRVVAERAGVGKSTVATTLRELEHRGHLGRSGKRRHVLEPVRLREDWIAAYGRTLRRTLLIGRYVTPQANPAEREQALEVALTRATRGRHSRGDGVAAREPFG